MTAPVPTGAAGLTPAQLAMRARRVTGTSAGPILGLHPHRSAFSAWLEITGRSTVEQTEAMRWGLTLQPVVARRFSERHNIGLAELGTEAIGEWLAASGDYVTEDGSILEIKTASDAMRWAWGADGTDQVPLWVYAQVAVQFAVFDREVAHVAVLIGASDYRDYYLERDAEAEAEILGRLHSWWVRHVEADNEPDGTPAERLVCLEGRYPEHAGDLVEAPPEAEVLAERWLGARDAKAYAEAQEEEAKVALCALIGKAPGIQGPWGRATWKTPKPSRVTDWEAVAKALGAGRDLVDSHTKTVIGKRRFLLKPAGEKGEK